MDLDEGFYRRKGLYLAEVKGKGKGVFCRTAIKKGTVIETTPCLVFPAADIPHVDQTRFYDYYFSMDFLTPEAAAPLGLRGDAQKAGCVPMGVHGFCNHAEDPNAAIEKTVQGKVLVFTLRARRAIAANEEICVSYDQLWFAPIPLPASWTGLK